MFDFFFFFNDTATTEIYTLALHDALPISREHLVQGVTAEQDVDAARIEQAREQRIVARECDDPLTLLLHLEQCARRDARHVPLPARRSPAARNLGWEARDGESSDPAAAPFGRRTARYRGRASAVPSAHAVPCPAPLRCAGNVPAAPPA